MTRRAAKVDRNQAEIVGALRAIGASVQPLHTVGQGCPDLLVGFRGDNLLVEVKDGDLPPSGRKLNERQVEWHGQWRGRVVTVSTVQEAYDALGVECYRTLRDEIVEAVERGDSDNLRPFRSIGDVAGGLLANAVAKHKGAAE